MSLRLPNFAFSMTKFQMGTIAESGDDAALPKQDAPSSQNLGDPRPNNVVVNFRIADQLSLIHISEPTRLALI
eukprot:4709427-Alexandrium_andersonii.AAC.1